MALGLKIENGLERAVFALGLGAACLSLVVFAMCALGWVTTPQLIPMVVVAAAALRRLPPFPPMPAATRSRALVGVFVLIAVPFTVLYLANAAAPEISPDGAGYHLGLVRQYLNHHGFFHLTTDFYANFPQGCEMLFLAAYALGGHSAAAMVHYVFLAALPLALMAYGRRFGAPIAGVIAALLFYVAPVAGVDGSSAYVDVALAFSGFLCFYALELWGEDPRQIRWLSTAGLMAGFAFAIKYTGVVVFIYAVGYLLLRRARITHMVTAVVPAGLMAIPWLVKNWIVVANPFSPFFNHWFPNAFIDASFEEAYRAAMRHFNGASLDLGTPFEVAIHGGLLQGTIGPLFLLAPLGLLALLDARGRRIWAAVFVFELPWLLNIGTRFLLPALPFLALAIGLTLARRPKIAMAAVMVNAVLCWPQVLALYCAPYAWRINRFPVAAALRLTPERAWVEANAPDVRFAWMLQDHAPANAVIYTAQPIMEAYTDRTVLLNYTSAFNTRIEAMVKAPVDPKLQPSVRRTYRFAAMSATSIELSAETDGPMVLWIESPGGFEAWAPRRGERRTLKIDAGVDRVTLRMREQDAPNLRISVGGRDVAYHLETGPSVPVPDLRVVAIHEIRRLGVTHLAIHDLEPLGPDIGRNPVRWHLRAIAAAPPLRLYEITPD